MVWDHAAVLQELGEVRRLQGWLMGSLESLGFELRFIFRPLMLHCFRRKWSNSFNGSIGRRRQTRC
ncbi:MAG: hypothetical protein NW241_17365 [Bacteroidia bacterium]|nr:hypothetical protein [Bacteroidia bacterium]